MVVVSQGCGKVEAPIRARPFRAKPQISQILRPDSADGFARPLRIRFEQRSAMCDDPICVIPPEICVICGLLRSTSPGLRAATLTFPWEVSLLELTGMPILSILSV